MRILRRLRIREILLDRRARRGRILEYLDGVVDLAIRSIAVPMLTENCWSVYITVASETCRMPSQSIVDSLNMAHLESATIDFGSPL
jgi:hypothetical protein